MINVEQTDKSIREILESNEVDTVIQSCNCFHIMQGPVSNTLNELTNGEVALLDKSISPYGDINKLSDWTGKSYTVASKEVDIFSLYTQYTLPSQGCETIHWVSIHDGLYDIIEGVESGSVVAIQNAGVDAASSAEFIVLLSKLAKKYDNDLPDVDIKVFDH